MPIGSFDSGKGLNLMGYESLSETEMFSDFAVNPTSLPIRSLDLDRAVGRLNPYVAESAIIRNWLEISCRTPDTLKTYVDHFRDFARYCAGCGVELVAAPAEELASCLGAWTDLSRQRPHSVQLLRRYIVQSFYAYVAKHIVGFVNPTLDLKRVSGRPPEHTKYLEPTALSALFVRLRAAAASGDIVACRDQEIIRLGIGFGLRNNEIGGLGVGDLYRRADEIRLQIQGKGSGLASVAMPAGALRSYQSFLGALETKTGTRPSTKWAAFPGLGPKELTQMRSGVVAADGWRLTTRAIHLRVAHWFNVARIAEPGLSVHSLRATFAVLLYSAGCPLEVIQRLMRHGRLETTQLYLSRLLDKRAESAMRGLDELLTPWMSGEAEGLELIEGTDLSLDPSPTIFRSFGESLGIESLRAIRRRRPASMAWH